MSESQLYDVLVALFVKRPEFRKKLGSLLVDDLAREAEAESQLSRNIKVAKRSTSKVHTSPPLALFAKVRRLVIMASKPNMKEAEVDKELEEEWERMGPSEKAKWQDLAEAGNNAELA